MENTSEGKTNMNDTMDKGIATGAQEQFERLLVNGMVPLLSGISTILGKSCSAALYTQENRSFICVAVENGELIDTKPGDRISNFLADVIRDEEQSDRTQVGIYYSRNMEGHSLKNVTNLIRSNSGRIIGCLRISIDLSIPLHEFIRDFIPVVDDNLANSLSEPGGSDPVDAVDELVLTALENAISMANGYRAMSPMERNKRIVKNLQSKGIFNIRGSTNIVAEQLGVSRYTVYNYLKAPELPELDDPTVSDKTE